MEDKSTTAHLTSQRNERVKQHIEFDGPGRTWKVYTAQVNAPHGTECEVTEYIYKDAVSTEMKARKEGVSSWDGAWDADFTV